MDLTYAKSILKALAEGVNPITGEILPKSDSCNQPDVIRSLYVAVNELDKAEKRSKMRRSLPENAGKPWTAEDDKELSKMFDKGCTTSDICTYFKRTKGGIASRLVRLGIIRDRDDFVD